MTAFVILPISFCKTNPHSNLGISFFLNLQIYKIYGIILLWKKKGFYEYGKIDKSAFGRWIGYGHGY